jgi:hypothetical protein
LRQSCRTEIAKRPNSPRAIIQKIRPQRMKGKSRLVCYQEEQAAAAKMAAAE